MIVGQHKICEPQKPTNEGGDGPIDRVVRKIKAMKMREGRQVEIGKRTY